MKCISQNELDATYEAERLPNEPRVLQSDSCPACGETMGQHAEDCWEWGDSPDVREYINQCGGQ